MILDINTASEWSQSGGIAIKNYIGTYFKQYDYSKLRDFLKKSVGEIKVVIRDKYSSRYNFTIDATGFSRKFSLL